jgi:hypothetical protein
MLRVIDAVNGRLVFAQVDWFIIVYFHRCASAAHLLFCRFRVGPSARHFFKI